MKGTWDMAVGGSALFNNPRSQNTAVGTFALQNNLMVPVKYRSRSVGDVI